MVTKNPLVMQLRKGIMTQVKIGKTSREDEMVCVDKNQVSSKIAALSDEILTSESGTRFGVSKIPIYLHVSDPKLVDLTLIDLPGLFQIDVVTKQPLSGVEDYLKDLYYQYTKSPTCTMIVVLPATQDLGCQLARGWAKEWDYNGERSLGVITKVDRALPKEVIDRLNDIGKNAAQFQLGTFALRNMTPDDCGLESDHVNFEKLWFETDESWRSGTRSNPPPEGCLGLESLINKLVHIQGSSILGSVPKLKKQIEIRLSKEQLDLQSLPKLPADKFESAMMISEYTAKARKNIESFSDYTELVLNAEVLNLSNDIISQLNYNAFSAKCFEAFDRSIHTSKQQLFCQTYYRKAKDIFQNYKGPQLDDLIANKIFPALMLEQNSLLVEPTDRLVAAISEKITYVCNAAVELAFSEIPQVKHIVSEHLEIMILKHKREVDRKVSDIFEMEKYFHTLNHYYSDTLSKLTEEKKLCCLYPALYIENEKDTEPLDDDDFFTSIENKQHDELGAKCQISNQDLAILDIIIKVYCYRKVVHKRYIDNIMLTVRYHMIDKLVKDLKDNLNNALSESADTIFDVLSNENTETGMKRKNLEKSIERLSQALKCVQAFYKNKNKV